MIYGQKSGIILLLLSGKHLIVTIKSIKIAKRSKIKKKSSYNIWSILISNIFIYIETTFYDSKNL